MIKGIAFGFVAYGLFTFGDACVKALSGRLSIFTIGFFVGLFALAMLPFLRQEGESWQEAFRPKRPGLVALRVASGVCAGFLGIVAFTNLPFAEAYAIIFLAPSFVTLLSFFVLKESVVWQRLAAVFFGFAGVLLVVRPGFQEVHPAHLAPLGAAMAIATSVLVLRIVSSVESRVTLLAYPVVVGIIVSAPLMMLDTRSPTAGDFVFLALAGLLAAGGQLGLIQATRFAPANRVAPAQYSQLVWAVTLGLLFFAELPDNIALAGLALVFGSGVFNLWSGHRGG